MIIQNELYHHGIKGMRWGVRRYQNPDGTRTAAGKRRERADRRQVFRKVVSVAGTAGALAGTAAGIKQLGTGVKKYRNADGTLTEAGRLRYERDKRENRARKKENKIDTSQPDPERWVKEDLTRSKKVFDASSDAVKQLQNMERLTRPTPQKAKLDLSNMSDQELRSKINRATLERQYNDLFAPEVQPKVSKGRQITKDVLEVGGGVLALGSSALGIALAIKELRTKD